jgi:Putative DNA-binding domain
MFPRTRHPYTFGELLALIRDEAGLWNGLGFVEVRSVAVHTDNGKWYNFATCLRLCRSQSKPLRQRIDLDRVLLLSVCAARHEITSEDDLRVILTRWRLELELPEPYPFQTQLNFRHHSTHNTWLEGPGWVFNLWEQTPGHENYGAPEGPFLKPENDIFAESVGALATQWLRIPIDANDSTVRHAYYAVVPDERAQIKKLAIDGEELRIETQSNILGAQLFCAITIRADSGVHRSVKPVLNEKVHFHFPTSRKEIQIWLLTEHGEWLDQYHENAFGSTRRDTSLLTTATEKVDPIFTELSAALQTGETDTLEFKPFVRTGRGSEKAQELIETVVAFANKNGGVLYIGVTDKLEPVGVDKELHREYARECQGKYDEMERAYLRDVRKLLAEGIDLSPIVITEWISYAQYRILKVTVPEGTQKPYSVASSGDLYIRTGANNRKLRQADIPRVFRVARQEPPQGPRKIW